MTAIKIVTDEIATKHLAVSESAAFGSEAAPIGITLYDKTTKQPYCLSIDNGMPVSMAGVCVINDQSFIIDNPPAITDSQPLTIDNSTEMATTTEPVVEPEPTETATSTEPVALDNNL